MSRTVLAALVFALGLFASNFPAGAQVWPAKPAHIVVPWPPGGSADMIAGAPRNL